MSDYDAIILDMSSAVEDLIVLSQRITHGPTVLPPCTHLHGYAATPDPTTDAMLWGFYPEPRSKSARPRLVVTPECLVGEGLDNMVRLVKVLATCDAPRRTTA